MSSVILLGVVALLTLLTIRARAQGHQIIECMILDAQGKVVRKFPGARCVFFADGSLVSGGSKSLTAFDARLQVRWRKSVFTHHQLNLSQDAKSILVMDSEIGVLDKKRVRFDILSVYDLQGQLLKSFSFQKHRRSLDATQPEKRRGRLIPIGVDMRKHVESDVEFEYSHANSFYEIPENALAKSLPAFTAGNYIVHSQGAIFVLDRPLEKILWSMSFPDDSLHDVQVQENGWILLFANFSLKQTQRSSWLEEIHPLTRERRVIFRGQPSESFYSEVCGGVQRLANGHFLTNNFVKGGRAVELDAKGKEVWGVDYPVLNGKTGRPDIFQQAKRQDLTSFLRHNSGL